MTHTPAPWAILNLGEIQRIYISGGDIVCDVKGEQQRENARLISAAPELLAALQQAERIAQEPDTFRSLQERESAMIAVMNYRLQWRAA